MAASTPLLNRKHHNKRATTMSVRLAQEKPKFYERYLQGKYNSIRSSSISQAIASAKAATPISCNAPATGTVDHV
jgi:hypothetical protein